jgi:hypothetical protein
MKANYIMVTWNRLDAAETVLGFLGSDRTVYSNFKRKEQETYMHDIAIIRQKEFSIWTLENIAGVYRSIC